MVVFLDELSGKTASADSVAGTTLRKGLCAASSLQQVGNGGDEGFCLAPPSQVLPLGRSALWLDGMVCCSSTSSQAPPLGRVNHTCSTSSQVPPLGRVNHISLSPVISPTVIHQQKYTKALCHSGVSQFWHCKQQHSLDSVGAN